MPLFSHNLLCFHIIWNKTDLIRSVTAYYYTLLWCIENTESPNFFEPYVQSFIYMLGFSKYLTH